MNRKPIPDNRIRRVMDASLPTLENAPWFEERVLQRVRQTEGEQRKVKKKISIGLVIALALALTSVVALAAGLTFSSRYDAKRAALNALEEEYGITEEMMTFFRVDVGEMEEHGAQTVTLTPLDFADRIGVYSVTVVNGHASASWSHDGETIGEGIDSPVYGAKQLALLCADRDGDLMAYLYEEDTRGTAGQSEASFDPEAFSAALADEEDAEEAEWMRNKEQAEEAAKLTLDECRTLAVQALKSEHGLSDAQASKLVTSDDRNGVMYSFESGHPVATLIFWLWQGDENTGFTEKDGLYWVSVNMDTGVIEDILYDSTLSAIG